MVKEKNGKSIVYKCGKKWEKPVKEKPIENKKKKAVKASESTEEVDNG